MSADRYLRERAALDARIGDMIDVTRFGGPTEFVDNSPGERDYVALAHRAYVRGDISADELEIEVDRALRVRT